MPSTAVPPSNFKSFFDAALADYLKQTGVDLIKYPLDEKLQNCHSVDDVLGLFQDKSKQFKDYRDGNSKLINCLNPAVKVIHVLSDILGEAASLVSLLSSIIIKSCFMSSASRRRFHQQKQSLLASMFSSKCVCPLISSSVSLPILGRNWSRGQL